MKWEGRGHEERNYLLAKAVLPSLGLRVMEGERKRRRGLTNFYFAPEFIFVKVRGDDGGLTGRSVYCFLTNLFTPNLRGRKPNPPLISAVSHSIPSLSSAEEHSLNSKIRLNPTSTSALRQPRSNPHRPKY
jgi:hypothetical protein